VGTSSPSKSVRMIHGVSPDEAKDVRPWEGLVAEPPSIASKFARLASTLHRLRSVGQSRERSSRYE
jgi:hypothetical protein